MSSKNEIEKAKEDLMFFNEGDYITREMDKSADVLEEYIQELEISNKELEKENNKLNKIIDEMIKYIADVDTDIFCDTDKYERDIEDNVIGCDEDCEECVKQYFEKKVEEK